MKRCGIFGGDRPVVVGVVRRVGGLGVDLARVRVHDDRRDALGLVGDLGRQELLLDRELEAGVDGQAEVLARPCPAETTSAVSGIGWPRASRSEAATRGDPPSVSW